MARQCKKSWLDTYMDYTENQESPRSFHRWVGLTVLSSCVGRNLWLPRIKYTIYPNLYIILVAESARCRKSVALSIGNKLLQAMQSPPLIFAQKITIEALIAALQVGKRGDECCGLIYSPELSVFLGADAIKKGIIPALTDLYDSPSKWIYHTRGRGKEVLHNVSLSMMAATTKNAIKDALPQGSVAGGFTSRIIFIYERDPAKAILFETMEEEGDDDVNLSELEIRASLVKDLDYIRSEVCGKIIMSKSAKACAWEWYKADQKIVRDSKMDGYFGRKHDTMFKVACLLSVSEDDSRKVEPRHIKLALKMLEDMEHNLGWIATSVEATASGSLTAKVLDIVRKKQPITHVNLLRSCWRFANAVEITNSINILIQSREMENYVNVGVTYYRLIQKEA